MTDTVEAYEGPVRVYLPGGAILTTGRAQLEVDTEMSTWTGMLQVLKGTAVDGKALVVDIEVPDGGRSRVAAHAGPVRSLRGWPVCAD